jgi:hypothetical protein
MNNLITTLLIFTFIFLVNTQLTTSITSPTRIVSVSPVSIVTSAPVVRTVPFTVSASPNSYSVTSITQPAFNTNSKTVAPVQIVQNSNYF